MILDLHTLSVTDRQNYLQHAIAPRPICFAGTMDKAGNINLSPFSFFNLFSINPPVIVFSPSRRARDNSSKHSMQNMLEVPEVTVNIVDYDMVQQTSLSSCEFPKGVNEFIKAGFTQQASTLIKPPMVKESKVKMECKVLEIKPLGDQAGAGNLVICEVLRMHIDDSILGEDRMIDQRKIHQVARLGGNWYSVINDQSLFQVEKPNTKLGIGVDALPPQIKESKILTGNNLGMLANVQDLPMIDPAYEDERLRQIFQYYAVNPEEMDRELQVYAKELLDRGKVNEAWQVLLTLN